MSGCANRLCCFCWQTKALGLRRKICLGLIIIIDFLAYIVSLREEINKSRRLFVQQQYDKTNL